MLCRTPFRRSAAELGGGVAAASAPHEKRLYVLISGMATLLFRGIRPKAPHNERSGCGIVSEVAQAFQMHQWPPNQPCRYYISPKARQPRVQRRMHRGLQPKCEDAVRMRELAVIEVVIHRPA